VDILPVLWSIEAEIDGIGERVADAYQDSHREEEKSGEGPRARAGEAHC
jgi:hypothetical protein